MKQSAAKTLGVAALGAAFAATGAGAAHAAPSLPDATQALGGFNQTLPTEKVSESLPGADQVLEQAQPALNGGLAAEQAAAERALAEGSAKPVAGLLGGLPVGQELPTQELPTQGLPTNGLPLDGPLG
ncbi:ATP-binding protein [Streptomyces sp. NPDC014995]|uniref:ATP-binding protein n=1 Tax=Streptomyces sp. NPDC014995 TaxID=3364936 RepID=UPI0036F4E080